MFGQTGDLHGQVSDGCFHAGCDGENLSAKVRFRGQTQGLDDVAYIDEVPGLCPVPVDGERTAFQHILDHFGHSADFAVGAGAVDVCKSQGDGSYSEVLVIDPTVSLGGQFAYPVGGFGTRQHLFVKRRDLLPKDRVGGGQHEPGDARAPGSLQHVQGAGCVRG